MKKKLLLISVILLTIIGVIIYIYPNIEFYNNGYLYMMSYSNSWEVIEDIDELEQDMCYDESYSYNKKRNISISNWEYNNFLFFKWFKVSYREGNVCDTEYLLEESYIKHFLSQAEIKENEDKIDLAKLIEGKKAIIGNKRYPYNDNRSYIGYILDGEYKEMFISISEDGLIVIHVGASDEGAKYIAYK